MPSYSPVSRRRFNHWIAGSSLAGLAPLAMPARAQAQSWPSAPLKFVVPYPAGGNADAIGRLVAAKMAAGLGQSIVVENKAGAGGTIGGAAVAKNPPDGITFLVTPTAVLAITPHMRKVGYEPLTDLMPVAQLSGSYGIVTARKDLPASNMTEFIALARKDPGKLTFGSAGNATATHISGEIVHRAAGIKLLHVPYKGSAEALTDLMAGRIDLIYDAVGLPQIKAGTVKALAVTSSERHPELPQVPTLAEQQIKVPGSSWFGLFAPKGTSPAIIQRLAEEARKAMAQPDTRERLARISQFPDYQGTEAFTRTVAEDSAFFKDLIQQLGLKAD